MKTWQKLRNNPRLWDQYFVRETILKAIRSFFEKEQFHEVEAPILQAHPPAESYLEIFETTLLDRHRQAKKAYLITSPEMALKKLLVAGIGSCFSLTKAFRNMETQSNLHNPEFTLLEWYRVNVGYEKIMEDCEDLVLHIFSVISSISEKSPANAGSDKLRPASPAGRDPSTDARDDSTLIYQGKSINLSKPWDRITVAEAFQKWASINFDEFLDETKARRIAKEKGYKVEKNTTWEELYNQIFLNEVEKHLGVGKPTILYEFPAVVAALSRKKPGDPRFCERFEFYIAGLELGDAYGELTDPIEIKERFDEQMREVDRLGKTHYEYDHDFIEALTIGMPPASGIAVGVDRLVMLFANVTDIADTLFFSGKELFGE